MGGAITSMNVTDQAVILINGQYGPEVGTQNNFRYTEKLGKPVIFLVNQLDSDKCDFDNVIATMKEIYGPSVFRFNILLRQVLALMLSLTYF